MPGHDGRVRLGAILSYGRYTRSERNANGPFMFAPFRASERLRTGEKAASPNVAATAAPAGVLFTPAHCERVIWNGPDTARFGGDQAAVVVLRKSGDTGSATQLWAELIAAPAGGEKAALGTGPAAGCGTVRGSYRGHELSFAEEKAPGGIGSGSRGAAVRSTGSPGTRIIAFLGRGYVGVVYAQGAISRTELGAFARHVYGTAHTKLG